MSGVTSDGDIPPLALHIKAEFRCASRISNQECLSMGLTAVSGMYPSGSSLSDGTIIEHNSKNCKTDTRTMQRSFQFSKQEPAPRCRL